MTTLKKKLKYINDMSEKYPLGASKRPDDVKNKIKKYGEDLRKNAMEIDDKLADLFFEDLQPNKKMSDNRYAELSNKIIKLEILSLDDIPELKKHNKEDSESDEESHKPLTIAQQNKIIRQIPDDTFTRKEIEQIIKHIRDGSMVDVEQMPNPTKKQPKVKLSDVVLDKKKK